MASKLSSTTAAGAAARGAASARARGAAKAALTSGVSRHYRSVGSNRRTVCGNGMASSPSSTSATRAKVPTDEPLAGISAEETERMLDLMGNLRELHAILLVEHDLDAVFRVADRITVMVNGAVLATDTPPVVRASLEVQAAHLGALR